jgi:hypothetical protein
MGNSFSNRLRMVIAAVLVTAEKKEHKRERANLNMDELGNDCLTGPGSAFPEAVVVVIFSQFHHPFVHIFSPF